MSRVCKVERTDASTIARACEEVRGPASGTFVADKHASVSGCIAAKRLGHPRPDSGHRVPLLLSLNFRDHLASVGLHHCHPLKLGECDTDSIVVVRTRHTISSLTLHNGRPTTQILGQRLANLKGRLANSSRVRATRALVSYYAYTCNADISRANLLSKQKHEKRSHMYVSGLTSTRRSANYSSNSTPARDLLDLSDSLSFHVSLVTHLQHRRGNHTLLPDSVTRVAFRAMASTT